MTVAINVIRILSGLLNLYSLLIIARCVTSFFPQYRYNRYVMILYKITEPILAPVRVLLWKIEALRRITFDLSPVAVMLAIQIILKILNYVIWFIYPFGRLGYPGNFVI